MYFDAFVIASFLHGSLFYFLKQLQYRIFNVLPCEDKEVSIKCTLDVACIEFGTSTTRLRAYSQQG